MKEFLDFTHTLAIIFGAMFLFGLFTGLFGLTIAGAVLFAADAIVGMALKKSVDKSDSKVIGADKKNEKFDKIMWVICVIPLLIGIALLYIGESTSSQGCTICGIILSALFGQFTLGMIWVTVRDSNWYDELEEKMNDSSKKK